MDVNFSFHRLFGSNYYFKALFTVVFSGEYLSIIVYKNVTINAHKYMEEPGGKQLDSNFLISFLVCRLKLLLNTSIF